MAVQSLWELHSTHEPATLQDLQIGRVLSSSHPSLTLPAAFNHQLYKSPTSSSTAVCRGLEWPCNVWMMRLLHDRSVHPILDLPTSATETLPRETAWATSRCRELDPSSSQAIGSTSSALLAEDQKGVRPIIIYNRQDLLNFISSSEAAMIFTSFHG